MIPLAAFRRYYEDHAAQLWDATHAACVVYGDAEFGQEVMQVVARSLRLSWQPSVADDMRTCASVRSEPQRPRFETRLRRHRGRRFLTQLFPANMARHPPLRTTNTWEALDALHAGLIDGRTPSPAGRLFILTIRPKPLALFTTARWTKFPKSRRKWKSWRAGSAMIVTQLPVLECGFWRIWMRILGAYVNRSCTWSSASAIKMTNQWPMIDCD